LPLLHIEENSRGISPLHKFASELIRCKQSQITKNLCEKFKREKPQKKERIYYKYQRITMNYVELRLQFLGSDLVIRS